MKIKGTITAITPISHVGQKQTAKQSLVLSFVWDEDKECWIVIDFRWWWTWSIASHNVWDLVEVHYDTTVNEYNNKFYTNINWKWIKMIKEMPSDTDNDLPF